MNAHAPTALPYTALHQAPCHFCACVGESAFAGCSCVLRTGGVCDVRVRGVQDVRYELEPKEGGGWSPRVWAEKKYKLGLTFPNLPYLIDGNFKITQSNACLSYAAEKAGLAPKSPQDRAVVCEWAP